MSNLPGPKQSYPTRDIMNLFDAVMTLNNSEEAAKFFRDLLTLAELTEFANRWQIVQQLEKKVPYAKIALSLNVSTATVTRVAHWLNHGTGGYKLASERLRKKSRK